MRGLRIRARGAGPAAIAAAKLLLDRGAEVVIDTPRPCRRRTVTISMETVLFAARLCDIDADQLIIGPVVQERRVDWSPAGPATVADPALVCDVGDFSAVLARSLRGAVVTSSDDEDADWILDATGRPSADGLSGGERVGYSARIPDAAVESITSIAATETGWTFTSPHPDGGMAIMFVVPSRATEIDRTDLADIAGPELIAPRLSASLCSENRIAVGDAAFTVDPLRGDGVGYALRGALLAQAVIAAIENGLDRRRCLVHYEKRIHDAFAGHLRGCCIHYRAARSPLIWAREITAMEELAARLDRHTEPFEFRLNGIDLVPEGGWRNGRLHLQ